MCRHVLGYHCQQCVVNDRCLLVDHATYERVNGDRTCNLWYELTEFGIVILAQMMDSCQYVVIRGVCIGSHEVKHSDRVSSGYHIPHEVLVWIDVSMVQKTPWYLKVECLKEFDPIVYTRR
jgi:hypothetical protein